MTQKPTFDKLVNEALSAPFEGWDFSWLKGRRTDYTLPWDYSARIKAKMKKIDALLDMGTGGGELLVRINGDKASILVPKRSLLFMNFVLNIFDSIAVFI